MVKRNIVHFKNLLAKRPASEAARIKLRALYFSQIYVDYLLSVGAINSNNAPLLFQRMNYQTLAARRDGIARLKRWW